ncbi:MAG: NAD-dependent epimerase/dehydratase family protein [Pirellulaceae bacterium]|nr:NAD-dependent epimerase/dehydratase family protein [Pirellulaceae bacterium]
MNPVFVTGPTGCIGAATVRYLLDNGVERVIGLSRRSDASRIDERLRDRITLIAGDVTDIGMIRDVLREHQPSQIIHLAAFQTPDCDALPLGGLQVNVGGTMALLQAASECSEQLQKMVFASSAAVYGPRSMYDTSGVATSSAMSPPNLYGYWKVAGEGMAQAFHHETGIATVSLRLATTYGPGRDQGLTAAPTTALKAVAAGRPFRIPYEGREHYHFVDDVGAGFGQAAIEPFDGYGVFNLRGQTVEGTEFLRIVRDVAAELEISPVDVDIDDGVVANLFVCDLDDEATRQAFPKMPLTTLRDGIRRSLVYFTDLERSNQSDS